MDLKDFLKDLAVNLDKTNIDQYKQRAASFITDIDSMNGDGLAKILNTSSTYDSALRNIFNGDEKKLVSAVKKMMKESGQFLKFAVEFYIHHKDSFKWFNKFTKLWLANPDHLEVDMMTDEVFDYWLDKDDGKLWSDSSMVNPFFRVIDTKNKKLIMKVLNHKNFKNFKSHYAVRELVVSKSYDSIMTKEMFDMAFTKTMEIISKGKGWNTDFSNELAPIIRSPYFDLKHLNLLTNTEQEISMYEYAIKNNIKLNNEVMKYFYDITEDPDLLPDEAKEVFLF